VFGLRPPAERHRGRAGFSTRRNSCL